MEAMQTTTKEIFVPEDFYCPISGCIMEKPFSDPEGNTYEESFIKEWLLNKQESPMTRTPLTIDQLQENIPMKKSIESIIGKLKEHQLKIKSKVCEIEQQVFIDCIQDIKLESYYMNNKLLVKVKMPTIDVRQPVDVVLCIDISGSMGSAAVIRGDRGEKQSDGFSILSLTVSAAKTILYSLNENDNLSVVVYTDVARTIISNIACNKMNKVIIEHQLDELKPENTTNLWDGIFKSLEILRTTSPKNRLKSIFVLTDGVPNVEPPRGHEGMLDKYFKTHDMKCMINCYGFGYSLKSDILSNISNMSGGDGFSYIPDASLLGNVFIHGISNFFTTAVTNPVLKINLKNNITFDDSTTTKQINIGSLKYGQDTNLVFNLDLSSKTDELYYDNLSEVELQLNPDKCLHMDTIIEPDINYFNEQVYRYKFMDIVQKCLEKKKYNDMSFVKLIDGLISEIKSDLALSTNTYILNILQDLEGQVKEALNMSSEGQRNDWYSRWGKHYLLSLQTAYSNELCNNFKDKGVSNFAGELFNTIRDEVSDIFDELPPPKSDVVQTRYSNSNGGGSSRRVNSPPVSMSSYNSQSGGCCAQGSLVKIRDNTYKKIENIRKGDQIVTIDENFNYSNSEIECIVKTKCDGNKELLVCLNNLKITCYHPIIDINNNKEWVFPLSIGHPDIMDCLFIYTCVVKNRKSIIVDNYVFATLDHNMKGNVIEHDYFGTEKVLNDLRSFNTYHTGLVCLTHDSFQRDIISGNVIKIKNYDKQYYNNPKL